MPQTRTCPLGHTWVGGDACPVCSSADESWDRTGSSTVEGDRDALPPAPTAAADPRRERRAPAIPGYEVLGELGRGGMGVVYQARHLGLKRPVALKVVLAGGHADPQELARFRAEAEAVARLQHPNVVQIYEVGEHDGLPFLALEFCAGGSLAQRLASTPLPPRAAAELAQTLAGAMHYAHMQGVVHRDLKPANILLVSGELVSGEWSQATTHHSPLTTHHPKITDFGLAKRLDSSHGLTQTGQVMGTPSYMAPEQASGRAHKVGPAADVYALGAVLYELLTGRPPFRAATPLETLDQVLHDEPVAPARLQSGVPRDLETVCLKCLHKEPSRRYASAAELADDLRRFLDGRPVAARRTPAWERAGKWARRRPAAAALMAVVALAAVTLAALGYRHQRSLEAHNRELAAANETIARERDTAQQQRQRAEDNLGHASEAVDQMLRQVGLTRLEHLPHMDRTRSALLEDALRFYDKLLASQSGDSRLRSLQADTYLRTGQIHAQLGRPGPARDRYDRALTLIRELSREPSDPAAAAHLTRLQAIAHNNLALLTTLTGGDLRQARAEHETALALLERLLADRPDDPEVHYALALNVSHLAIVAKGEGKHDQVVPYLTRAQREAEELVRRHPDNRDYAALLGRALNDLAVFWVDVTGELPRAVPVFEKAIEVKRGLVAAFPGDPEYQSGLAQSLSNLGWAWQRQGELSRAQGLYQESFTILERLARDHPEVWQFVVNLGWACIRSGDIHAARREFEPALGWYTRAVERLEAAQAANPGGDRPRTALQMALMSRAMALNELKRPDEALADLGRAIEVAEGDERLKLRGRRAVFLVRNGRYSQAVAEAGELVAAPSPPVGVVFDAARVYAVAARQEADQAEPYVVRAVQLLTQAQAAGYFQAADRRKLLESHPDFTALRGRSDFEALRAAVKAQ